MLLFIHSQTALFAVFVIAKHIVNFELESLFVLFKCEILQLKVSQIFPHGIFPESTSPSFRRLQMAGKIPFDTTCASATAFARPPTSCAETARGSRVCGTWRWTAGGGWGMRSTCCRESRSESWRGACPTLVSDTSTWQDQCLTQSSNWLIRFLFSRQTQTNRAVN